ncbi:MAG TPA: hypothetical protein DET40_11940 [Lentisphaeria bacterium]|nr:MAG: hypothetical protein A2X45_16690 [Lentisphaerae bacterium GWF2_50_93]HCE44250.1 hypothetical protein [Lentisphaeria bacterium]
MKRYLSHCSISPGKVYAGDSVEFKISIIAGKDFSAEGTRIVLDHPAYLGTDRPSRYDQEDGGYADVFCSNAEIAYNCRQWDMEVADFPTREKSSYKGMAQRLLVLDFISGKAQDGDEILIKWGWTRNGFGIGCKAPTVVPKPDFINTVHIRYFSDGTKGLPDFARSFKGYDRPIPDVEVPVSFQVLPREPESMRLIRGQSEDALLVQDRFFNICPDAEVPKPWKKNSWRVAVMPSGKGKVEAARLPLRESPPMNNVFEGMNVYFGDLHNHSAFSNDCIEREKQEMTPDDSFGYARNVARLDFQAVTDHHQPWDKEKNKIGEEKWNLLLQAVEKHCEPGRFLAFPGFEYRCSRGDAAVVFAGAEPYSDIDRPELCDIRRLWDAFNGKNYITIPHFHNGGRLPENEWPRCPYEGIETILEICSCHGSYDVENSLEHRPPGIKNRRADRNGMWMLRNGLKYGLCCNSDGHKGNAGMNGLTAVYARELTKEAIFEAIRKRQVYGTTNARIRLLFTADGKLMGSTLKSGGRSKLGIELAGEMPFKSVELHRNGELYRRWKPFDREFSMKTDAVNGQPSFWHVRAVQTDNEIAWSSPIWFD